MTTFVAVMTYAMAGLALGALVIVAILILQAGLCLLDMMADE
jgi:hypothetical protein